MGFLNLLFGCRHLNRSKVYTIDKKVGPEQICLDCAARRKYILGEEDGGQEPWQKKLLER